MSVGVELIRALLAQEAELALALGAEWASFKKQLKAVLRKLERAPESAAAQGELERLIEELMQSSASALVRRVMRATPGASPSPPPPPRKRSRGARPLPSAPSAAPADDYTGFYPVVRAPSAEPAAAARADQAGFVTVPVFYGTNRAPTGSRAPSEFFGRERGSLAYGVARVSIPHDHRVGNLEKPRWWKLEFVENPQRHVVLLALEPLAEGDFSANLKQSLSTCDPRDLLLFLHGYNVTFEDAARRTAQIAYDLEFKGRAAMFSWPSQASVARYTVDETNVEWSVPYFEKYLRLLLTQVGARNVYVIAHSMGNRALVRALHQFDTSRLPRGSARLSEVVFAAPDIDAETFVDLARAFRGRAGRFTLYASAGDEALKASKAIHKHQRAGDGGPEILVVDGVDTIDATAVDTSLLGHSYYGDNRSILSDIHALVHTGAPAEKRFGLRRGGSAARRFWVFKP